MGFEADRLALTVELSVPGQPLPNSGLCDELLFRPELVAASSAQVLPLCLLAASSGLSLVQRTKRVRPSVPRAFARTWLCKPEPHKGSDVCFRSFLCVRGDQEALTCCVFRVLTLARGISWSRVSPSG